MYKHAAGSTFVEATAKLEKLLNLKQGDAALLAQKPGGVDLSGTKDIVQFNQGQRDPLPVLNIQAGSRPTPLTFFKGFSFQVIECQPISNPVEIFLGPSMGKNLVAKSYV